MEAVFAMKDNWDFVISVGEEQKDHVLPVAAIYGANAGGKSNVIKVLRDAAQNICERRNWMMNDPFLLTDSDSHNDEFEHSLNLLIKGYEYAYSYTANDDEVIRESLQRKLVGNKDFEYIFSREGVEVEPDTILSDSEFTAIENAAKNTEYLIVNSVATLNLTGCSDIYQWCKSVLAVMHVRSESERKEYLDTFAGELVEDVDTKNRLAEFISKFDPALTDVRPFDTKKNTPSEKRHILGIGHRFRKSNGKMGTTYFSLQRESHGTQKVLELFPTLMDALDNGRPIVIDELDTMLHPLIFKKIVALFNEKDTNPFHAQLIFASHNTEVMNREDLRRDEIHIIEKSEDGVSSIFRLSDFVDENGKKIRMDARYDRVYLEGLLGSIPSNFEDARV